MIAERSHHTESRQASTGVPCWLGAMSAVLVCLLAGGAVAHDPEPLQSVWASKTPAIDGDLADWQGVNFVSVTPANGVFDGESGTTDDPADFSFTFAVMNDASYLYVAVRIVDDTLVLDSNPDPDDVHARAWMDDAIEIFIDGDHSHSPDARDTAQVEFQTGGEYAVVANGAVTSDQSGFPGSEGDPERWEAAGSYGPMPAPAYQAPFDTLAGGATIEARLSYNLMGQGVGPGGRIGFTISAHDDDDGGNRDTALYWKGISPSAWKDEAGWGDLILATPATLVAPASLGQIKADRDD
ncbi:MAG: hypothetical protein HN712_19350 [Gemmatimonadetes bacterium]|jgi:hypothetical protein|nr:hypothetical protein [Gemmatimonadota bacterium]MBT7862481.1 hypothetical protein [Gemmatimonadota bacterium]